MTQPSDIAVVIPFYNGSAFIRRAIESVLAQTLPPAEFVIVNDGSTDEERAFLHTICTEFGVRVVDRPNGGQGAARNTGVAETMAPYVCFLDQDDFYLHNHHEVLRRHVPDGDPMFGWVYGDLVLANEAGRVRQRGHVKERAAHPKRSLKVMLAEDLFILPSATLLSRAAFDAVGGFDERLRGFEDDDLFRRLFEAGFTNSFVDEPVYFWCMNRGSTMYGHWMLRSRLYYLTKLMAAYPDDPASREYFIGDLIWPRLAEPILGHIRAIQRPDHRLHSYADELHETTKTVLQQLIRDHYLRGNQLRYIKLGWAKHIGRRHGWLSLLSGRDMLDFSTVARRRQAVRPPVRPSVS